MNITEFLLARIAEDEAKALGSGLLGWARITYQEDGSLSHYAAVGRTVESDVWVIDGQELGRYHVTANHDERRVLAECAAKRAIIEWHQNWPVLVETEPTFEQSTDTQWVTVSASQEFAWLAQREFIHRFGTEPPTAPILSIMAQVYADHPDFNPEWRA